MARRSAWGGLCVRVPLGLCGRWTLEQRTESTEDRAQRTKLGEMEALDPRPWRLDVLQWPEMKAEASHDVACSRVIVVPADEAYAGSEFFRRWVEDWPAAAHGRRLLLMPRRGAGETPLRVRQFVQWLQAGCARKGMELREGE